MRTVLLMLGLTLLWQSNATAQQSPGPACEPPGAVYKTPQCMRWHFTCFLDYAIANTSADDLPDLTESQRKLTLMRRVYSHAFANCEPFDPREGDVLFTQKLKEFGIEGWND